jgi:hypothetical protein
LLARDRPADDLVVFAGQAALALELASGYTDALHAVRSAQGHQAGGRDSAEPAAAAARARERG